MKQYFLIFFSLIVIFIAGCSANNNSTIGSETVVKAENYENAIKIPLSEISTTAKFFNQTIDGVKIEFFVVKSSNGEIKVAFNACDVCYGNQKGYVQEGKEMVCNNCKQRFEIDNLDVKNKVAGCWPSYLESKIEGDSILISQERLSERRYMFEN
ncbi:MAG: DUF2318 domain-containing protein [Nanoarchaeota archaeon]|mgnify:CR=1 FL=1